MFRRGGSIAGRGGHFDGGNRSDEERKRRKPSGPARARCAASDGGRKCGARRFTNYGVTAPPAFARHEVAEYDRRMESTAAASRGRVRCRCEHGTSSGAGSSSMAAPLPPTKREEEEQDRPSRRGLLRGDFTDDEDLPWIIEEVIQHSKQQQEEEACRQLEEELQERRLQAAIQESFHPVIELSSDSDGFFDSD